MSFEPLNFSKRKVFTFHTILQVFPKILESLSLPGVLLPVIVSSSFPFSLPKLSPPTLAHQ